MAFTMRQATKADLEDLVRVHLDAFTDDIFSRQAYPRTAQSTWDYWRNAMDEELDEHNATFLILTSPGAEGGQDKVAGYIKWVGPDPEVHDADEDGYPPEGIPDVAAQFYKEVAAGHKKLMEGKKHWYLDMMGVARDSMGKGGAKQLIDWGLKRADEDKLPCYVDAMGQAKSYYERFGFVEVRDKTVVHTPEGDAVVHYMIREPVQQ